MDEKEIRADFEKALEKATCGEELSQPLGWGFSLDDLLELMMLHKKNKFRTKIEELLTDCNFHTECKLLKEKDYINYIKYIMQHS